MYALATLLDKHIHIVATPFGTVGNAIVVLLEVAVVRYLFSCHRIRIEIVVHMDAVDVISGHDVVDNANDILAVAGCPGLRMNCPS